MAVCFKLDDFTENLKMSLAKELTLIPLDPYLEKMKKRGQPINVHQISPVTPVLMFTVDKVARTIKIPFYTAAKRMSVKPNRDRTFPKLEAKGKVKFHAKLRDYQVEPAAQALAHLKEHSTCNLNLPVGHGKTIVGAYLVSKVNGPCLVLVHRLEIAKAWVKTFSTCYPSYADSILLVGENDFTDGVLTEKGELVPRFCVTMAGRTESIPQYIKDSIAVLIIDECHLLATASRVDALLCCSPKYIITESATFQREDGMHSMIESIVGQHLVYELSNKPHRVYCIETGIQIQTVQGPRGTDFGDLTEKLSLDEDRNDMILDCVLCNMHHKIMIICRLVTHAILLEKLLTANGISVATLFGTQKRYSDSHVLIGTLSKIGVGFDESNACEDFKGTPSNLLILCSSIANISTYEQCKGRVCRSNDPIVFYMRDNVGIVERHITNTFEWIEKTKGVIHEIKYESGEMSVPNMVYKDGVGTIVPPPVKKLRFKKKKPAEEASE